MTIGRREVVRHGFHRSFGVDPRKKHPGVYDTCPDCGGPKAKKAYRCRTCTPLYSGENNYAWKGDAARHETKRSRVANRPMPTGAKCEDCGAKAIDRHHKDGDPGSNGPDNIAFLCRRCHMLADGRLQGLLEAGKREPLPPRPCVVCERLVTRLRLGRCGACRAYLARNGRERYIDGIYQVQEVPPKPCAECGKVYKPLSRGLCHACYERKRRRLARGAA